MIKNWKLRFGIIAVLIFIAYSMWAMKGLDDESCGKYDPSSAFCVGTK